MLDRARDELRDLLALRHVGRTKIASCPSRFNSSTMPCRRGTSLTTSFAPSPANASATALPMPDAPAGDERDLAGESGVAHESSNHYSAVYAPPSTGIIWPVTKRI